MSFVDGSAFGPYKLGRKKMGRYFGRTACAKRQALAVAESEQRPNGESESKVYCQSGSSAPPAHLNPNPAAAGSRAGKE